MARADFAHADAGDGGNVIVSSHYRVRASGTATINAGELCRRDTTTATYAQLGVNGDDNTRVWLGVAASDSNETTTVDGDIYIFDNLGAEFKGRAVTSSNLVQARRLTSVTLNVASGTNGAQKVNESTTTNGFMLIKDFDAQAGMVFFVIRSAFSVIA